VTDDGRHTWREIRAIASLEALDGVRSRRQLVIRAITPIVLFVCLAGLSLGLRGTDTRTHPQAYDVAVAGDVAGASETLARLRPDRLTFRTVDDARLATIDGAEAGVELPDGLDATLANGDRTTVIVYTNSLDPGSRAAAALVQSAITDLHAQQVHAQLATLAGSGDDVASVTRPGAFSIDKTNVERTTA